MIKLFERIETEKYIIIKILFIKITFKKKSTKSDIDAIVWWIPFRGLRNATRNLLNSYFEHLENIEKLYFENSDNPENIKRDLLELKSLKLNSTKPIMSDLERELFINTIKNSKYYLEFGGGGSTFLALKSTNAKVVCVEGDINWINFMRMNYFIYEQELLCRLKFYFVYIGKIRDTSYPIDDSEYDKYPNYSSKVFEDIEKEKIDTVFIDGRFRVSCALQSIINLNKNVIIIIHDFFDRNYYHVLLNYLECINRADTLGVFKIKENIDYNEIKELIKQYQYDLR